LSLIFFVETTVLQTFQNKIPQLTCLVVTFSHIFVCCMNNKLHHGTCMVWYA